ncbi:hypothetical protein P4B35_22615 [Pontiellaceae bacterium B12227]|nr:hypothetical protein [Pontiellaceae bacterium B12227]
MKCQDAQKWILLQDSGEMPAKHGNALAAHMHDCEPCREFQFALIESQQVFQTQEEPSATAVQNVLREARLNVPEKKRATIWVLKPALVAAAALVIGVGLFFSAFSPDKVGMELVVNETQLLTAEDQVASVMYNGLSDDDLAFNFLMTYEDSYASL